MEESFSEFRDKIVKRYGNKAFKIRNSWGVYDAYKHIRRKGWYSIGRVVTEKEFYSIIRGINDLLAEELKRGGTVIFPAKMGKLELKKLQAGVSLVDGKLKITYPIDWDETVRLWYKDEEAKKNKTLLRRESKYVYRVKYNKFDAWYTNKDFYQFTLNRFIKKALKENIEKGQIDTLWEMKTTYSKDSL